MNIITEIIRDIILIIINKIIKNHREYHHINQLQDHCEKNHRNHLENHHGKILRDVHENHHIDRYQANDNENNRKIIK